MDLTPVQRAEQDICTDSEQDPEFLFCDKDVSEEGAGQQDNTGEEKEAEGVGTEDEETEELGEEDEEKDMLEENTVSDL